MGRKSSGPFAFQPPARYCRGGFFISEDLMFITLLRSLIGAALSACMSALIVITMISASFAQTRLSVETTMLTRRSLLTSSAALAASTALPVTAFAKAPMLGAAPAAVHRYKIGGFELTAVRDGQVTLDQPWTVFGENQTPERVKAASRYHRLPEDKHTITFTPVIVNTGNELVLFDTGWGSNNPGRGQLAATLAAAGYTVDQIDVVCLTHCHPDHMGGLMDGDKPVFPNARYVVGATEYNFWTNAAQDAGGTKDFYQLTKAKLSPLAAKTTFLREGASATPGITAVETFGHTPGHMSFRIESEGKQAMVTGDICNHHVLSMQKPKWHVLFDMDKEKAVATRIRVLDMIAKDRIAMIGYHMPFPAVGFVTASNNGGRHFHWDPVSYQFTM
jgi:glyoxylase-like metal-dependent hydrolase (beta-lactamase superfamily II)